MAMHEIFRERLARFERRRALCRTDDRTPVGGKHIDNAKTERQLGTDDGQIHFLAGRDFEQPCRVGHVSRNASSYVGNSWISWCAKHFGDALFGGQFPNERMLPGSAADDEDLHENRG